MRVAALPLNLANHLARRYTRNGHHEGNRILVDRRTCRAIRFCLGGNHLTNRSTLRSHRRDLHGKIGIRGGHSTINVEAGVNLHVHLQRHLAILLHYATGHHNGLLLARLTGLSSHLGSTLGSSSLLLTSLIVVAGQRLRAIDHIEPATRLREEDLLAILLKPVTPLGRRLEGAERIAIQDALCALNLSDYDAVKFDSLYSIAGEAVKNAPNVVKEKARCEAVKNTSEGKMFVDFTIEKGNADGTPVKFSDYVGKGKYVLVDFWASWCDPCRGEMPNLANVYKQYKGDKFEIVGVAVWDERADTEKALGELPISWPVIFDAQKIPDPYKLSAEPNGSAESHNPSKCFPMNQGENLLALRRWLVAR